MEIFNSSNNLIGIFTTVSFFFFLCLTIFSLVPEDRSTLCPARISDSKTEKVLARDELSAKLAKASDGNNKTVIIAVINKAYVQNSDDDDRTPANMLDLFLESFWLGEQTRPLINYLLVVAADRTAYDRCVFRGLNCHLLPAANHTANRTDGPDSAAEQIYMSKGFMDFMWRRTSFLLTVLRKGYSFIFTDADVMWLRNPLTNLDAWSSSTADMEFSTDWFNGNSSSTRNQINTGFYRVRSNNRTISLFKRWYRMRHRLVKMKEQDVLQRMIWRGVLGKLNLTAAFLDTRYFSGFCEDSKDLREVVTVHANCCRYISAKVKDLGSVLAVWKRFRSNGTDGLAWSPHFNCQQSWAKL